MSIIYHIIGLEGCGHHGLESIVTNIINKKKNYEKKNYIHSLFNKVKTNNNYIEFERNIKEYLENSNYIIYTDDSYPSGKNRDIINQLNIIKMNEIISKYAKIKFLYLNRNIYNTINSHPNFDNNIINHTKKIMEIKNYIERQLEQLEEEKQINIVKLYYEDIDTDIGHKIISIFFCINFEDVKNSINKNFFKSTKDYKKILSKQQINNIDNILKPS
jgi:hypothetical protein